ncbi:MAG: ABC transporter ATP-binding protein [Alphaproteobacteria bacterium HGW-Alphaproteobacteria-2]|nr:MAG: ABC transporter ATP-binding protein [Alphaproteobacteria bacterium HGW-Alphaproteobacteria-2]
MLERCPPSAPKAAVAEPLLAARGLGYAAGGRVLLQDIGLGVAPGERLMVLGPNGAGKSLLLRLLHGLIAPATGAVLWRGRALDAAARRAQAMVFQQPVLLRRSVRGNLRFALGVRGLGRRAAAERTETLLAEAGLTALASQPARRLSGGEQQRLALARALATDPEVLFLDEPTASLDPTATHRVEEMVRAANTRGVTIVMITHDAGQARRLGTRAVFLDRGRLAEEGPVAALARRR